MKDVDPAQINVYLDGLDVSDQAIIDSTYLTLPAYAIMPGIHTVRVNITNVLGQKYNEISWSFSIIPVEVQSFGTIKQQSSRVRANYNGGEVSSMALEIGEIEYHHELLKEYDAIFYETSNGKKLLRDCLSYFYLSSSKRSA